MLATPELIAEAAVRTRLAECLPGYLQRVPLYRDVLASPPLSRPPGLDGLPFITKADIRRDFPANFLGVRAELESLLETGNLELEHTSGTSEERTALLLPAGWWAEQEQRALRLNGLVARLLDAEPRARRATLSSPVCSSDVCYTTVPTRADRVVGETLFLSLSKFPFLWSEADLARIAAEVLEWEPRFLDVDPVYGVVFALYCERRGIPLPSLRFVLCSYEFVSRVHRQVLQRAFGVPVFDLYGSTETGHLLMEDEHGEKRASHETAALEVLNSDAQGIGDLVVTTLSNDLMPLVRYRIGDLVERREFPYRTRYVVHGRAADAFHTLSGKRVTTLQVDQCFAGIHGVAHYQVVEHLEGPWMVRVVKDGPGPEQAVLDELHRRLAAALEPAAGLKLEVTDMVMPESSGKFRLGYPARRQ